MLIIEKSPLRVSLSGGSTDLQEYLDTYHSGKVISFTPNLFTYIVVKKSTTKYYKIVYSKIENVLTSEEIQNDIAREVLTYFKMPPVEVVFMADIPSTGSGLASSSSYLISMIKACLSYKKISMSVESIGKLAIKLERSFNLLAGYQDVYGCLIPGFKVMNFNSEGLTTYDILPKIFFNNYDLYLVSTNNIRSSTSVLSTLDFKKVRELSTTTDYMLKCINNEDCGGMVDLINIGWEQKKLTSKSISNSKIEALESKIKGVDGVVALRLLGAGNGGYFLVITNKSCMFDLDSIKIDLYE